MRFAIIGLVVNLLAGTGAGAAEPPLVATTEPLSPAEEAKKFHLPPGFEIQLVASEPDIHKPINMNFDAKGRLWVTDSVEYPFPAPPDRKGRDRVVILEDTDGDGKADKVTTFAEGLNIPIGILPLPSCKGCIVYSIPNLQLLLDTDGDGKADVQRVLYSEFGFKDTHGMVNGLTMGFDGWVYACHGFSNSSTAVGGDGSVVRMQSGNTFRFKPDGSRIEQWTWGQVNPFGMALDPLGNLYTADCHSKPVYQLLRGAYYPSFGKPHDGLGYGPEMCSHSHGSTAICGLVYYAADHFPKEYHDTLFIGNVVTNRINHDKIEWHGSTPKAIEQPDFLTSDDPWFRPVDIKLGPDGALYVADFYNRIIGHYEVPLTHPGRDRERGRIWRIVYKGKDGKGEAKWPRRDWTKASNYELLNDLGHPNLTVRLMATNQIVERGSGVVPDLWSKQKSELQRTHWLWVEERLWGLSEATLQRTGKNEQELPADRVQALRALAESKHYSDWASRAFALDDLRHKSPHVQRAAADVLVRHPSADNVKPILKLRTNVPGDDTHLLHTVRMALREQLRVSEISAEIAKQNWSDAEAGFLIDASLGAPTPEVAALLLTLLDKHPQKGDLLTRSVHHIARYGTDEAQDQLHKWVRAQAGRLRLEATLFKAIQQGAQERGRPLNPGTIYWGKDLAGKLLRSKESDELIAGAELADSLKYTTVQKQLSAIADDNGLPAPPREAAVNALTSIDSKAHVALFGKLLADAAAPPSLREKSAQSLASTAEPEALDLLLLNLPTAPARLQTAIATGLAGSPAGAAKLLEAVGTGKASARLLQDKVVLQRLNQAKVPDLAPRLAKLTEGLPPIEQRWQELIKQRATGFARAKPDLELGAKLFTKHCANCHQIANQGAKIGPQLDGIGIRGLDRLLEDVLDPNRNVDQAFRSTTLVLTKGQILNGLVLREEGEVVVMADQQGKEVRIEKKDIDERSTSQLSPMPPNLVDLIPEGDFYHLMAYLLQQRAQPAKPDKQSPPR